MAGKVEFDVNVQANATAAAGALDQFARSASAAFTRVAVSIRTVDSAARGLRQALGVWNHLAVAIGATVREKVSREKQAFSQEPMHGHQREKSRHLSGISNAACIPFTWASALDGYVLLSKKGDMPAPGSVAFFSKFCYT